MKFVAMVAFAAALVLGVTMPRATAATSLVLFSDDGITFAAQPSFTLFDDVGRIVPSDRIAEAVWIKNAASTPGRLRLDIVNASTDDTALASMTFVGVDVPGVAPAVVSIAEAIAAGECTVLSGDRILQPGEVVRFDAVLTVSSVLGQRPGDDGREGALGSVRLDVRATLSDAAVPALRPAEACELQPEPLPEGVLTGTGAEPLFGALAAGGVGVLTGAGLYWSSRSRKERADD